MSFEIEIDELDIETEEPVEELKQKSKPEPKKTKPKKKPTWSQSKYSKNPVSLAIDKTATDMINTIVLTGKEKLQLEETRDIGFGATVAYALDYYLPMIPVDHPLMLLGGATIGLVVIVQSKKAKESMVNPK